MEHTKCVDKKDFDKWQENGGHEVDEETAIQIANQLEHLIKTGHAEQHKKLIDEERTKAEEHNNKVQKLLDELRLEVKKIVGDEKGENLAPAEYPEPLNKKWWEITNQTDYRANYPFSLTNVREFIDFARNSGGFRIC
jgi:hypothetical protein